MVKEEKQLPKGAITVTLQQEVSSSLWGRLWEKPRRAARGSLGEHVTATRMFNGVKVVRHISFHKSYYPFLT